MSHGTVDQVALDAIKRASTEAAKRGLRVTGVASRYHGGKRAFSFEFEPVRRPRAQAQQDAPVSRRGVQGSLL